MVLSDADILKFQELYKKEFGVEIDRQAAYEQGIKLLRLMEHVCKPMIQEKLKQ